MIATKVEALESLKVPAVMVILFTEAVGALVIVITRVTSKMLVRLFPLFTTSLSKLQVAPVPEMLDASEPKKLTVANAVAEVPIWKVPFTVRLPVVADVAEAVP